MSARAPPAAPSQRTARGSGTATRPNRSYWLERHAGDLICVICGARKSERPRIAFEIDHGIPLEDGGADEEWKTQPLCADSHAQGRGAGAAAARGGLSARVREVA